MVSAVIPNPRTGKDQPPRRSFPGVQNQSHTPPYAVVNLGSIGTSRTVFITITVLQFGLRSAGREVDLSRKEGDQCLPRDSGGPDLGCGSAMQSKPSIWAA